MNKRRVIAYLILTVFLLQGMMFSASACKDIIACGDATAGDYNLLLKVRDPSRPGYQVLQMIPKGYQYTYPLPWTGIPIPHFTSHKYIGVASKDDVPPSIFKPGMCLTDAGIAFGDADSLSGWVNPSKHAWDDFDWIRYSCERADSTDEAVHFLTTIAVDLLHAPGVSENLFVVGPDRGYLIEADAFRYHIKQLIDGVDVISNYPRELWKTQWKESRLIASSFDAENEKSLRRGGSIRLQSLCGIRVKKIGSDYITATQIPFFTDIIYRNGKKKMFTPPVSISLGERKTIGDFSVTVKDIVNETVRIHIETKVKAWHDEMTEIINQQYGNIKPQTLMSWSRLQTDDLEGLRGMCQPNMEYEGVAIYKIPNEYHATLSAGWFSPNHATTSIFVPFHICNNEIFEPYTTGEAAILCSKLSNHFGNRLVSTIEKTETVFLAENQIMEQWAKNHMHTSSNVAKVLTLSDVFIQKQAFFMQRLFEIIMNSPNTKQQRYLDLVSTLWQENYVETLPNIKEILISLSEREDHSEIQYHLENIALSIVEGQIEKNTAIGLESSEMLNEYNLGKQYIQNGQYEKGFTILETAYCSYSDCFYNRETSYNHQQNEEEYKTFTSLLDILNQLFSFPLFLS